MKYIILDRDGVINYDSDKYIKSPDEWHAIPGSLEAIAELNQDGYEVIIATNQSGIARGLYSETTLHFIHQKLTAELAAVGGRIKEIFYCPHHPDEKCHCRKPQPGMLQQIQQKYALDLTNIFFVGDSYTDVEAAKNAGCKPLLVLTGNGKLMLKKYPSLQVIPCFNNLSAVARYVISYPGV